MDRPERPEPGLIKWSPNPAHNTFIHVNLQQRFVQAYEPTGYAHSSRFDYKKLSKHEEYPFGLTTYDWSPSIPGLVAMGTMEGVVNLLRIDDNSNSVIDLRLRVSRLCHAVAFNTGNLLAVGLERVRNDQCLHIWDVNRVSTLDPEVPGFPLDNSVLLEPVQRLEPSVSVSSVKFFEDNPQTLAVGIKNQGIRIYDLRDPHGSVINYQTRMNNNISIDYADQNYFASSALDHPGVAIWDRRATSRPSSSQAYLDAVDKDNLPWGAALKIDKAIDMDLEYTEERNSLIRSLRFCRDRRGLLAVLSRTGQLRVIDTQKEFTSQEVEAEGSPELLQARRSHDLDLKDSTQDKRNDRIVSFDWVNLESPALTPRALVLRHSGAFGILEVPHHTTDHIYKLVPWQAPYRGLQEGTSYHSLMEFEQYQTSNMLGPMSVQQALAEVPIFGEPKPDIEGLIQKALQPHHAFPHDYTEDVMTSSGQLPEFFSQGLSTAQKLQGLRGFSRTSVKKAKSGSEVSQLGSLEELTQSMDDLSTLRTEPPSNRQLHEKLLSQNIDPRGLPKEAQIMLDHILLLRANSRYLLDPAINRDVVSDDPWLRDLWDWISGAEQDAAEGGMTALGMDLSYMGVRTVWANDLGKESTSRLAEGTSAPDRGTWERCLQTINTNMSQPKYDGAKTSWPAHRQTCIRICGWGRSHQMNLEDYHKTPLAERTSSWHTMATAHALFDGDTDQAIQLLKKASTEHPELLFVSLALQLIGRDPGLAREQLDFDDAVASKTDPYLRAISSLIATSDWETIANQESLPLRERTYVALRYFDDDKLSKWLDKIVTKSIHTGDIEGIVLTGITDKLVDILATYVEKFYDVQTATLVMSICVPRYIDDYRCHVWRNAYRAYLQRHKAFYQRTKFEVESTKRSKRDGVPTVKPPSRQIALRCVFCDAEYELSKMGTSNHSGAATPRNPLMPANVNAGASGWRERRAQNAFFPTCANDKPGGDNTKPAGGLEGGSTSPRPRNRQWPVNASDDDEIGSMATMEEAIAGHNEMSRMEPLFRRTLAVEPKVVLRTSISDSLDFCTVNDSDWVHCNLSTDSKLINLAISGYHQEIHVGIRRLRKAERRETGPFWGHDLSRGPVSGDQKG
ncbi:putative GATOR complex protein MIO zinc-ribbon like domain-containing protein [Seiridium cardinale]|uniref:GATOR complex protein MIO zinc-ribbon like domain-containing protein n=1 Tax=Seiridium cardinale TaxID=138064 RepID=A0ABR2Y0Q4_9PEZI